MLDNELDFRAEAQAMEKIAAGVAHTVDGRSAKPPILVPRPVPGLCSGRVLVMEYVQVGPVARLALVAYVAFSKACNRNSLKCT